ncbi:MAG: DUF445 family protein [Gammaproteobacteria bacterium]|nr:DUF445 family protein [Gammaproteobacteria bacterium]
MAPELLRALLTIGFGALAGGLTNTLAVWMLFHPHEPPRLGRRRLRLFHGAIPKNQGLLAEAAGRTVRERLLSDEDLTAILSNREFRDAFDRRLERFLSELLDTERGSLRESLSEAATDTADRLLDEAGALLAGQLIHWVESAHFEEVAADALRGLRDRIAGRPAGEFLTPAGKENLAALVAEWAVGYVHGDTFRNSVERQVDAALDRLLRDSRTLGDLLPDGIAVSFERMLAGYLPAGVRKLGGILEDPGAREHLESAVHGLFQRFLGDLRLHQRIVARLVVTDETLERVFETLEQEGPEHLSELLLDPAVQAATARHASDILQELLRQPAASLLGEPGEESRGRARAALSDWIVATARDPALEAFLTSRIRHAASGTAGGSWSNLLRAIPSDRVCSAAISLARSDAAHAAYPAFLGRLLRTLLDIPVGRPAEWLAPDAAARARRALSDPLWRWIRTQIPGIVETLDVGRRVEEKVRAYPAAKLEEVVRRVTARELRVIVRLGYVLGAAIGGILVVVTAAVG